MSLFHFTSPLCYLLLLRWEERSAYPPAQHSFASEFPAFGKRIRTGSGRERACRRCGEWKRQREQQWDRLTKARLGERQDQTPLVVQRDTVSSLKRMLRKRGEGHLPDRSLFLPSILPAIFPSLFTSFLPCFLPSFPTNGMEEGEGFPWSWSKDMTEDSPQMASLSRNVYLWRWRSPVELIASQPSRAASPRRDKTEDRMSKKSHLTREIQEKLTAMERCSSPSPN